MILNMTEYTNMLKSLNISIIYSGPMWQDGIKGIADMVQTRLQVDDIPGSAAKSIFSVFIEQVTNVLMYSEDKVRFRQGKNESTEAPSGTLVLGHIKSSIQGNTFFVQTGNTIKTENAEYIKNKIDHLNTLDKKELRKYLRERLHAENDNPDSKGAGLGLIEIARRATAPIGYSIEPRDGGISYLTVYAEVGPEKKSD